MKKGLLLGLTVFALSLGSTVYGQGPGMWGGGYGMGPGMMGPGWGGYGPGMMGGYGMGPGYGGGYGYGMGPGMMGPGWRQGYGLNEECQKYLDETAGMRKELNNKRFEYFEAMRNPKTKPEELTRLEKEVWELQQKIYSKAPAVCR
jgi:hypothetical protein